MKKMKTIITVLGTVLLTTACATNLQNTSDGLQMGSAANVFDLYAMPEPAVKRLKDSNPTNLLFVGNSYLYYGDSVHNHVRRMVSAAGLYKPSELTYKSSTIGGAAIFDHNIDHLLKPENLRVDRNFDVVILQGGSAGPLSKSRRAKFADTVSEFSDKIEQTGGETVLYMTHAYVKPHTRYSPGMIEDIASLYISAGNENNALVIPVGLAFEEAYRRRPDIKLHKSFDGSHPDLAGTYLAAATVFASIYDVSPIGNSYDYHGALDPETVRFLQTVSQDTVTSFYNRN